MFASIEEQLQHDTFWAKEIMLTQGKLTNCFIGLTADKVLYLPMLYRSEAEKERFLYMAKLAFIAFGIERYTAAAEAWMVESPIDMQVHDDGTYTGTRPSLHPKRIEVLIVTAVARDAVVGDISRIKRKGKVPGKGKVIGLEKYEVPGEGKVGLAGTFLELLPPPPPPGVSPERLRAIASKRLEELGAEKMQLRPRDSVRRFH